MMLSKFIHNTAYLIIYCGDPDVAQTGQPIYLFSFEAASILVYTIQVHILPPPFSAA